MSLQPLLIWFATGFGAGALPWAPGTAGALIGVVPAVAMGRLRRRTRLVVAIVLIAAAMPICSAGSAALGGHDSRRIVADELLTFPLVTAMLPIAHRPAPLAAAFVASRLLDVAKPPPALAAEQLPGGIGIVMDDVVACLWTVVLGHAVSAGWRRWWWPRRRQRPLRHRAEGDARPTATAKEPRDG